LKFDPSKYHLGNLCKRGHDFSGEGESLCTKRNECVECRREYARLYTRKRRKDDPSFRCAQNKRNREYMVRLREESPEELNSYKRKQYRKHAKNISARRTRRRIEDPGYDKEWKRKEYETNKDVYIQRARAWADANPEKVIVVRRRSWQKWKNWKEVIKSGIVSEEVVDVLIEYKIAILDAERSYKDASKAKRY